jgi:hypothetical protein
MRDTGKIRQGSVRVIETETEENRDMFDENNEGYKGRAKPFMNNKKTIHERITQAGD